uniref:adenylate/guanylate cyclase domain-containing protein n=1 Tax=Bradyrhizobium brasilense TaxID=1419277 RepID=UPI0035C70E54
MSLTTDSMDRRLAAVLAADIAGYSRLMGIDEEGTLAKLKSVRRALLDPALAAHRGRVVKTTGDGILVEFASAVDAVRSAVEVQRRMADQNAAVPTEQRLEFRIGIHVGDIIFDDNDIFGDGVNIAARLEGIAEPGGVCISDDVQRHIRGKVDATFEDMGPQVLKNIAEPIRTWRVRVGGASAAAAIAKHAFTAPASPAAIAEKASIAVLPFQNMSGDPEQEYFADGVVEDIITALSRFRSLFVIARNSSFTYKGKSVDIKQVGHELGVRYVLEGSVRKSSGRVRITAQLIEAGSGTHLWADRFDGELRDVFDLQDQVTANVVSIIAPKIQQSEIERTRTKPTDRLDSYDLFLRGIAAYADRSKWGDAELGEWFNKACGLDPNYAAAQVMLAYSSLLKQTTRGTPPGAQELAEALRIAEFACVLASDDPFVLARAAHMFAYLGHDYDRAETMIEEAISLNSNDAAAWGYRGWISLMCAQPARAIESFEHRLRLSPIDPGRASMWNGISFAHFMLGQYEQGRAAAAKALVIGEDAHTLSALIMNEVGSGRLDEARVIAGRLLKLRPDFRASYARQNFPTRSAEWGDRMVAVLCEAGIPA